jgi:N-acetylglutamate synthase-like GNAT family acetyltransferase
VSLPEGFRISLDPAELQMEVIHGYLSRSYWSPGIPVHAVERAVRNSLVVGVYGPSGGQVGFARMVTDHASFGYLADVFVLEEHQGKGLGKLLVQALMDLPEVKDLRTILLLTRDAHDLYETYGFQRVQDPSPYMAIRRPGHYPLA